MNKATRVAAFTLLAAVAAFALINTGFSESRSDTLPPGKWTISSHPYLGPMYESQPVKVIGVISNATKGYKVTHVGLMNTSSKVVSAVKLSWYVSSEQTGNTVLLQGETQPVSLKGGLPVGKSEYFKMPVLSFGRVSKPLLKEGALHGAYRMEVAVTGILYEDGSMWEGDPKNMVAAVKAGLRVGPAPQAGCANQVCYYASENRSYRCGDGGGAGQMCTNCGQSCISSVCGTSVPSCGPSGVGELESE